MFLEISILKASILGLESKISIILTVKCSKEGLPDLSITLITIS